MAIDSLKVYQITLNSTGSNVEPANTLILQLSGSLGPNFTNTSIVDSVLNWQTGKQISGATMIAEYGDVDVIAARLVNSNGVCINETSNQFVF